MNSTNIQINSTNQGMICLTEADFTGGANTYGTYYSKQRIISDHNLIEEVERTHYLYPNLPTKGRVTILLDGKPCKVFAQLEWRTPQDIPLISRVYEYSLCV